MKWEVMKDQVRRNVSALPIPEAYQKRLLRLIEPLGTEITDWCLFHCRGMNVKLWKLLPRQLIWTMHGTVDYINTAELMVKKERLSVETRFEIASIHCLDEKARELFQSIYLRWKYLDRVLYSKRTDLCQKLIVFFTCTVYNRPYVVFENESAIVKCLFEGKLCSGNQAAFEYLFNKVSQREKDQVLEGCLRLIMRYKEPFSTSSLPYYLSLMNEELRERLFRECTCEVLKALLRWPLQSLFVEAAKRGWQLMDMKDCRATLLAINTKFCQGFRDFDYPELFWECWVISTDEYKKYYLNDFEVLKPLLKTKGEKFMEQLMQLKFGAWRQ